MRMGLMPERLKNDSGLNSSNGGCNANFYNLTIYINSNRGGTSKALYERME